MVAKQAVHPSLVDVLEAEDEGVVPATYGSIGSLSAKLLQEQTFASPEESIWKHHTRARLRSVEITRARARPWLTLW